MRIAAYGRGGEHSPVPLAPVSTRPWPALLPTACRAPALARSPILSRTTPGHAGVVGRSRQRGSSSPCCWLVLDHADRLAGSELLAGLMRAREDTGADVAVLMLGHVGWGSGRYLRDTSAALPPKEVYFGAYRPEQLQQVGRGWPRRAGGWADACLGERKLGSIW